MSRLDAVKEEIRHVLLSWSHIDRKEIKIDARAATPATMITARASLFPVPFGSDSSPVATKEGGMSGMSSKETLPSADGVRMTGYVFSKGVKWLQATNGDQRHRKIEAR